MMMMLMRNLEVEMPGSRGHLNVASAKVRLVQSRNSDHHHYDDELTLMKMMMMIE